MSVWPAPGWKKYGNWQRQPGPPGMKKIWELTMSVWPAPGWLNIWVDNVSLARLRTTKYLGWQRQSGPPRNEKNMGIDNVSLARHRGLIYDTRGLFKTQGAYFGHRGLFMAHGLIYDTVRLLRGAVGLFRWQLGYLGDNEAFRRHWAYLGDNEPI